MSLERENQYFEHEPLAPVESVPPSPGRAHESDAYGRPIVNPFLSDRESLIGLLLFYTGVPNAGAKDPYYRDAAKFVDQYLSARASLSKGEAAGAAKVLRDWLAAQDATKAYMRSIPDGMLPEQNHLGRLLNAEEKAEAAARAVLAGAAVESRDLGAVGRMREIGETIRTQDSRITEAPLFAVQEKKRIWGPDQDGNYVWKDEEWLDVDEAKAAELDAMEENFEKIPKGYTKAYYEDIWVFVTACFTEQGCKDYIARNGHNLNEPRIYAYGSHRNEEWRAVRSYLMSLGRGGKQGAEGLHA